MHKDNSIALSRRGVIAGAAATALAPVAASAAAPHRDELGELDATATAQAIRDKHITALEAVDAAIKRAEAMQPKLNFLVTPDFQRARDKARAGAMTGPFAGVPFLVKDLNDYIGLPTRSGSRINLGTQPATRQAPYIDAFDRAGLVVIGKSATPEYGFLPTTEPIAFGPTHNPWNLAHSSGGSSGGAAAATAAHVVAFAHASDGGGSIRIPSSNCLLFGLKPSRGRMLSPGPDEDPIGLGVEHCVARTVRDSAALFALTEQTGPSARFAPVGHVTGPSRRRLRVGLLTRTFGDVEADPAVRALIHRQAETLRKLGHTVVETKWPTNAQFMRDFLLYWAAGAAQLVAGVARTIGRQPDEHLLEPFTLGMAGLVAKAKPGELEAATGRLRGDIGAYAAWLQGFDVVLSPVLRTPAAPLGYVGPSVPFDTLVERLIDYVGYTPLHNVSGAPAMSLPAGLTPGGLPVGAQYAAEIGNERLLFELAYELEQARPWRRERPTTRA